MKGERIVIAGSRTVDPTDDDIDKAVAELGHRFGLVARMHGKVPPPHEWVLEVICGDADGADNAGARWGKARGVIVHHEPITAEDMRRWGKYVGPKIRNKRMADIGTSAIAFWDGTSNGTTDMVTRMVLRSKPVLVVPSKPARRDPRTRSAKPPKPCCPRYVHGDGTHDLNCKTGGRNPRR